MDGDHTDDPRRRSSEDDSEYGDEGNENHLTLGPPLIAER